VGKSRKGRRGGRGWNTLLKMGVAGAAGDLKVKQGAFSCHTSVGGFVVD